MRQVTIYTTNEEYNNFLEMAKTLDYVKKIVTDDQPNKDEILNNIKSGLKEVYRFNKGELKTTSAKDFLNEL